MRKVFVLLLVGLIGVLLFSSVSIAAAGLEIGDLVYRESPGGGWNPGHVGIFIGYYDGDTNLMVVDAVPPKDTPVRKITLTQFKTEGPYRGGKTYKSPTLTTQQRENICKFAIGKVNNWKYCGILHTNQKGEDGEHCDCVGLGEAAYESIGLDPVPDEGLRLWPEEQFISSKFKTAECVTDDDCPEDQWCEEGECVPEASTLILLGTGLIALFVYARFGWKDK